MSLSGLTLGIGLVSDVSVMVLDLLHRSFGNRLPGVRETALAVSRVSLSSLGGTLTTIVVFVPVFFLPGPLGALYRDLSLALIVSVSTGWAYSQFFLPALYRLFFVSRGGREPKKFEKPYRALLRKSLKYPRRAIALAVLFSLSGMGLLLSRPAVFMPPDEAEELELAFEYPPGTDLAFIAGEAKILSEKIAGKREIKAFFGRAGAEDEDGFRRADVDYRRERLVFRCFLSGDAGAEAVMETFSREAGTLSSALFTQAIPRDRTSRLLGLGSVFSLALKASSPEGLKAEERRVRGLLEKYGVPGNFRPSGTRPEIRVYPDREAAAFLGVSSADIAETLYASTKGLIAGQLESGGRPLDIRVSAMDREPGVLALAAIPLAGDEGAAVPLGVLVHIEREEAEAQLARLDRSDALYLDLAPGAGGRITELQEELFQNGLSRADESAFRRYRSSLVMTLALVLALLYMVMGAQFESLSLPPVIMLTIPFSLAGAGPLLFITGAGLDSGSVLGLVVLFGLAVNNGIVLYESSIEKIEAGAGVLHAVYSGAAQRLRPVLITTLTTLAALLPVLFASMGASQRSMASAMLGGLAASTLLCLFVLPPVLVRFFKGRLR
jgi:multidrug efflux pump subunit AcrB